MVKQELSGTVFQPKRDFQRYVSLGFLISGIVSLSLSLFLLTAYSFSAKPNIQNFFGEGANYGLKFTNYEIWYYALPIEAGISLFFGSLLLISAFKKTRYVSIMECLVFLNSAYFWTSHFNAGNGWIESYNRLFIQFVHPFSINTNMIDYLALGVLSILSVLTTSILWKNDKLVSLGKIALCLSLYVLPLGLEIYFFDKREFYLHVTNAQAGTFLTNFTNADILYVSLTVFLVSSGFLTLRRFAS